MKKVLFVCLGNICRSPAAEGIFKSYVQREQLTNLIEVDSAGTSGYHEGDPADERMRLMAKTRGYDLTSLSRPFDASKDFANFDYIITMDQKNQRDVLAQDRHGEFAQKVLPMVSFCRIHSIDHVPDPYYRGDEGFEHVLDILEDACSGLLTQIKSDLEVK